MADEEKDAKDDQPVEETDELTEEELEEIRSKASKRASSELLFAARANNSVLALKFLEIAARVDLTEPGSYWSSLHYAALHGNAPLVDGLLALNANEVPCAKSTITRLPTFNPFSLLLLTRTPCTLA